MAINNEAYERQACDDAARNIPCPKCGGSPMHILKAERKDIGSHVSYLYKLFCSVCLISGPAMIYEPVAGNLLQRRIKEENGAN